MGWGYLRLIEALGLATVKHVPPHPRLTAPRPVVDPQTLQAVIANRYAVLAEFARSIWETYAEEIRKLQRTAPRDARALEAIEPLLDRDGRILGEAERRRLAETLPKSRALETAYASAASSPRCGGARSPRASSSSPSCRTGAAGRKKAASARSPSSPSACAATPERGAGG